MKKLIISFLLIANLPALGDVQEALQKTLDDFVARHPASPGVVAAIKCDDIGLNWTSASGFTNRKNEAPLSPDMPYRIASNTKSYVAAAILRLKEQNKLNLEDRISEHLSEETLSILSTDYKPDNINIRHLLTHTAGLNDHAADTNYIELIRANPQRHWTAKEQIRLAVEGGDPIGTPGGQYRYSDTGYVLLGEIIERRSKLSLAAALRKLLKFEELGLEATWLETVEPWPEGIPDRPVQYFGPSFDTANLHPSMDLYGGGGLIATMDDVAEFYEALFDGRVFDHPDTLWLMRTSIVPDTNGPTFQFGSGTEAQYTLGLFSWDHDGNTVFGHGGFWGTMGGYVPNLGISFAWSMGDGSINSHTP